MDTRTFLGTTLTLCGVALLGLSAGCSSDGSTAPTPIVEAEDEVPPLTPYGVFAPKVDTRGFSLTWDPNSEADLAGYNVYVYDPSPLRENAYVRVNDADPLDKNTFVYRAEEDQQVIWVRISAVDVNDNESPLSAPTEVSLEADPKEAYDQTPINEGDGRGPLTPAPPGPNHPDEESDHHGGRG